MSVIENHGYVSLFLVNVYVIKNHGYVPFVLVNVYVTDNNGYVPFVLVNVYVTNNKGYVLFFLVSLCGTRTIEQNGLLMQIILDGTSYKINQLIPYTNQDLVQIERATQHYCFVLHQKRTEILKNIM